MEAGFQLERHYNSPGERGWGLGSGNVVEVVWRGAVLNIL